MTAAQPALGGQRRPATGLDRRFEAIVFGWDCSADPGQGVDGKPVGGLIEEACAAGLELVVLSDTELDTSDRRLGARPRGPGVLLLVPAPGAEAFQVGPEGPQTADAGCRAAGPGGPSPPHDWFMSWLWRRGIAPEQVLIAGRGSSMRAGSEEFAAVLEDQIARRRHGALPICVADPEWSLVVVGVDPLLERVHESLMTLADGRLGTRGCVVTRPTEAEAAVLMSGAYTRTGAETHLLAAPRWNAIVLDDSRPRSIRRVLDLHAGVLRQELDGETGRTEALLLSSLARPGTAAFRVRDPSAALSASPSLVPPHGPTCEQGKVDECVWTRVKGRPGSIVAAGRDDLRDVGGGRLLDRIAAFDSVARGPADQRVAVARVRSAARLGFDGLLSEHRSSWAARWEDADIAIGGDAELQLAVRFAIFHLLASAPDEGEAAVGARGLTGSAYRGHVFWDTDVYVLPMLAATRPPAARAVLEYRVRRLRAAVQNAGARHHDGARFPWESAWSGEDVTPDRARGRNGEPAPILTGELEEHIVADVAWAAACYLDWTGDQAFAVGPGRELIVQTARWWASRIELDADGRGHIRGVIGPDEYHENVDDNAYTNVMARWNLKRAAAAAGDALSERERRRWLELADAIVDGYDPATGIYEQFAGFNALEPLLITELAPRVPVAADMLLGRARTQAGQVLKQADALMLHYLVPDEVADGSLRSNLDFYGPRTSHGSTLSPGVHATLLARDGRFAEAVEMLRLTARIDLDDIGQMAAGGLHLAAMGSVWRALTFGFAGLKPAGDALVIQPALPPGWDSFEVRVRYRGSRVRLRIHQDTAEASADPPLPAVSPEGERVQLKAAARTFGLRPPRSDP